MADETPQSVETPVTSDSPKTKSAKLAAHYALPMAIPETLVKIIKGYAIASNGGSNPVNYKDVASATGLNPTVVSRNNSFLAECQIITSPKYGYYVPGEQAVKFAREAAWDEPNAKTHLRAAVTESWFAQVVSQNFFTRPTLTRDDLRRVLAIKSGATEGDTDSLGRLIDFLLYIGLVAQGENGGFTRDASVEAQNIPSGTTEAPSKQPQAATLAASLSASTPFFPRRSPNLQINLNITVGSVKELTKEDAIALRSWINTVMENPDEVEL